MQSNKLSEPETRAALKPTKTVREVAKLSEVDSVEADDLQQMFGAWLESDHCDRDYRYR